jgi:hypothetical protein
LCQNDAGAWMMPPPPWTVSSTMTPISGSERKRVLDGVDIAERHAHRVVGQLELAWR